MRRWPVLRVWLERLVVVVGVGYPAALLLLVLLFRFIGETWWVTFGAMYLPRWGYALPLPFVLLGLYLFRLRRLLWAQIASGLSILALMGFAIPLGFGGSGGKPTLRVLSLNVCSGYFGNEAIMESIASYAPDVVLAQEASDNLEEIAALFRKTYPEVHISTQFVMASRFPVRDVTDPGKLPSFGRLRSSRSMRYLLETSLGPIAFYNVHPISPREAFHAMRRGGTRHAILSGELIRGAAEPEVNQNTWLRRLQLAKVAELAAKETVPVVIAGDTNSPGLSEAVGRSLGDYQDGFRERGFGFGYTYPARLPWLRLDRIFVSRELAFAHFENGCRGVSDHLCVVADIYRR